MKKDLILVLCVAALAATAFLLTGEAAPITPPPGASGDAAKAGPVEVIYRSQGGAGPLELFEVTARGPGECAVRYQARGGPLVERGHVIAEAAFRDLLERLARAAFFDVEEVPRSGYNPELATTTVALTIGDQQNRITVDGRRRPSRDLTAVHEFFADIRKAVTPEPVSTGD